MNYIIEGTISELCVDEEDKLSFKVIGTEGFSLKQGEKRFNVLIEEDFRKESDKEQSVPCFVLTQDFQFSVIKQNMIQLLLHSVVGKKIELKIQIDDNKKLNKYFTDINTATLISSIKILQN